MLKFGRAKPNNLGLSSLTFGAIPSVVPAGIASPIEGRGRLSGLPISRGLLTQEH